MNEENEEWGFDYKWLDGCQFSVPDYSSPEMERDCEEPAIAYGWWSKDGKDGLRLCREHLDMILEEENKNEKTNTQDSSQTT